MMKITLLHCIIFFLPALISAQWQPTGDMGYGRSGHAGATYTNTNELPYFVVSGGYDGNSALSSAEIFDESTETWDNLPDMNEARMDHTADHIGNQRIIMMGGWDGNATNHQSTEILQDNNGTLEFSDGPDMASPRSYHSTALYGSNALLVMGGYDGSVNLSSCEKLNLTTMQFEAMESMHFGRSSFTVTPLANGYEFLVTGGFNPDFGFQMNQCEIYNALNDSWTEVAPMNMARDNHAAVLLPDNRVLVAGGRYFNGDLNLFEGISTCEIYDPTTNEWSITQSTSGKHSYNQLIWFDGRVILPGSTDHSGIGVDITYSNTEFFDPSGETWSNEGITVSGRYQYAAGFVTTGLVVCGGVSDAMETGEIYYFQSGIHEAQTGQLYPSMVHVGGLVSLPVSLSAVVAVEVYNAAGQRLWRSSENPRQFSADFPPGMYLVQIQTDVTTGAIQRKIIVY